MSATALVSVEEYLSRPEKPYCEYVDGVLYPKAMPTLLHGFIQGMLFMLLRQQGIQVGIEVTVRIAATKYLIPDVIAAPTMQNPYPTEPVLLCVEILSPTDRVGAMLAKCEEYHAWGAPFCWIIDPEKRTGWQYHRGGEPERVDGNGTLTASDLSVGMEQLFEGAPSQAGLL